MAADTSVASLKDAKSRWRQDPEGVREDILTVALAQFSSHGLSGARMDEIAAKTRTSKRMIYYYFGSKEGLYQKALEVAYQKVRAGEEALQLSHVAPEEALGQLAEFTFDHHRRNPDFIRLVMIENIHHGRYLEQSESIKELNRAAISKVSDIYDRGVEAGVFRDGVSPVRIHWMISALSFFNVSNQATFSLLFGPQLFGEAGQGKMRRDVREAVLGFVRRA